MEWHPHSWGSIWWWPLLGRSSRAGGTASAGLLPWAGLAAAWPLATTSFSAASKARPHLEGLHPRCLPNSAKDLNIRCISLASARSRCSLRALAERRRCDDPDGTSMMQTSMMKNPKMQNPKPKLYLFIKIYLYIFYDNRDTDAIKQNSTYNERNTKKQKISENLYITYK